MHCVSIVKDEKGKTDVYDGIITDISISGIKIKTSYPIAVGTDVKIRYFDRNHIEQEIMAKVKWEKPNEYGAQIMNENKEIALLLSMIESFFYP